ncbi:unnamed protein product, partial [Meganyctiphanes norvegica]
FQGSSAMEIIHSNKGTRKLLYDGYAYTVHKENKTRIRWICSQKKSRNCNGAISTDILVTDTLNYVEHSHEPDHIYMQGLKVRDELKSIAEGNTSKPGQIITAKLSLVQSKEVIQAVGTTESLTQLVRRVKKGKVRKDPSTIEESPVPSPEEYASNIIYDNESSKPVILFATDEGPRLLENADAWFIDGTNLTAPPPQ